MIFKCVSFNCRSFRVLSMDLLFSRINIAYKAYAEYTVTNHICRQHLFIFASK